MLLLGSLAQQQTGPTTFPFHDMSLLQRFLPSGTFVTPAPQVQLLLFSATFNDQVKSFAMQIAPRWVVGGVFTSGRALHHATDQGGHRKRGAALHVTKP